MVILPFPEVLHPSHPQLDKIAATDSHLLFRMIVNTIKNIVRITHDRDLQML